MWTPRMSAIGGVDEGAVTLSIDVRAPSAPVCELLVVLALRAEPGRGPDVCAGRRRSAVMPLAGWASARWTVDAALPGGRAAWRR